MSVLYYSVPAESWPCLFSLLVAGWGGAAVPGAGAGAGAPRLCGAHRNSLLT